MQPAVSFIPHATSSHEQTGDIITFLQFEEGNLLEKYRNLVEDKPISDSIDESFSYDNSDDEYISTDALEDVRDGSYMYTNITARDAILKIRDRIRQAQSELKVVELLSKRVDKGVHKVFKVGVK